MRETVTIVLAGQSYPVRPLTMRQVEAIDDVLAGNGNSVRKGLAIVAAGLARDHAAMTLDALYEVEITASEIATAMSLILRQGGFLPGEAPAAAPQNASTGGTSAAA